MKLTFQEYQPKKIVNVHKHVDGPWFWGKYTAHPYVGCRSGCEYCYLRGSRYLGRRDPESFDSLIKVKTNAVELLRRQLPELDYETISVGDWQQPAEERYKLSRGMLKVVLENGFPLFIVERSPLLTRDIDLLIDINRSAWVGVVYSISTMDPELKRIFEPRSPGVKRRLKAMERLASVGILVGVSLMPIFPFAGDSEQQLEDTIRAVKDHGGTFVMGGGLTMDGQQAKRTLKAAGRLGPSLVHQWRELYGWVESRKPNYGPSRKYNARLGWLIRDICSRHNMRDRMPRYIAPGPLASNKRVAEYLFLKTYDLELKMAKPYRIWAYRKAAWTVDEWPTSIADIYDQQGEAGLLTLPGIGNSLADEIGRWLRTFDSNRNQTSQAVS